MAGKQKGLTRYVRLIMDEASAKRIEREVEESLSKAGEDGAKGFFKEIRSAFNAQLGDLRVKLAKGLISKEEFQRQADEAAKVFNTKLLAATEKLRASGNLTDKQFLSLTKSLKQVGDTGTQQANLVEQAFTKLRNQIVGVFAVSKVFGFLEGAVHDAAESDRVWTKLGQTVRNTGTDFARVRPEVERTIDELERATRFDDDELVGAFQTLVRVSGDYAGSLRNVITVADVATGTGKSLEESAVLVGRAMIGQTDTFARMGITIKAGIPALDQLRERFHGLAEEDARSLGGRIDQLSVAWGNFRKAIGFALLDASGGTSTMQVLTDGVRSMTQSVGENADSLKTLGAAVGGLFKLLLFFWHLVEDIGNLLGLGFLAAVHGVAGAFSLFASANALATRGLAAFLRLVGASDTAERIGGLAASIQAQADALRGVSDRANQNRARAGRAILQRHGIVGPPPATAAPTPTAPPAASGPPPAETPEQRTQRVKAGAQELDQLREGLRLRTLSAAETKRLGELERSLRAEIERGGLDLETRNAVAGKLADIEKDAAEARKKAADDAKKARDEQEKAAENEIKLLNERLEAHRLQAGDIARAIELQRAYNAELAKGNLSTERELQLRQRIAQLQPIAGTFREQNPDFAPTPGVKKTTPGPRPVTAVDIPGFGLKQEDIAKTWGNIWLKQHQEVQAGFEAMFAEMDRAAESAFQNWITGAESFGDAIGDVFKGIGAGVLAYIAEIARGEEKKELAAALSEGAWAVGSFAFGNPVSGTAHLKSAGMHALAAAGWGLLAGASSGANAAIGGSGGARSRGDFPQGPQPVGKSIDSSRGEPQTVVQIYIDPLDPTKPAYQRNVAAAVQAAGERYRDAKITVYPRTGAGEAGRGGG